jgi:hypothetical protein
MKTLETTSLPSFRQLILTTPFYFLIPVGFGLLPSIWGESLIWTSIALGVIGWVFAFMLRSPVALIVSKKASPDAQEGWVVLSSGPLEELVRLCCLILAGRNFSSAYSIGLGWAGIEVLYAIVSAYIIEALLRRTDEEALQVRQYLEELGMLKESGPLLGLIERIFATGVHIGFTLLIAKWNFWVLVTIVVHSSLNLTLFRWQRYSTVKSQILIAIVGILAFVSGLAIFAKL